MRIRQWRTWFLVLGLVAILAPGAVLAQAPDSEPSTPHPFAALLSMIWDQLGAEDQPNSGAEALPEDFGAGISSASLAAEGSGNDIGPSTSRDGADTEGAGNNMGPFISPDG